MEVEKEVIDGTEPMSVESQVVPSEPSRVPRLLEALHPRLDAPEGFTNAVGELEAPKLAKVVNAVLIEKNTVFPEQVQVCGSKVQVCGSKVWLAKMKSALSELDGCPLDAVRARCVVQDVAKGSTASSLGLSATTPSLEALRTLQAIAAKDSMDIATLDVSTAFLHSPLPKGEKAVIMLPRDVSSSSDHYAPVYMILDQAMNGRVAAKAWNLKLANVVKKVGLNQCPTEPSVFEGTVKGKRFLMLCYVDDLILCGSSEAIKLAIKLVTDTLNSELKIKKTGRITPIGGRIVFLGREIERHGEHLRMRVPPKYMESLFETDFCKDLKVLSSPPDIVKTIEKGRADPEKDSLLTEAAAMRYRAVLGRIAWWAQSRPDLARWMSILSQGVSGKEIGAELRAILTAVQESEGLATLIGQLAGSKVDLQPMVESLRDEELQRYKESFEKLSRPNLEVYEQVPMPGKVMAVLDMRAQFGGKSVIWE
eukprot:s11709_g1.t1